MGKKRKSDLEIVVNYFLTASLLDVETTLTVVKSIVAGRSPVQTASVKRKRVKAMDENASETVGNS